MRARYARNDLSNMKGILFKDYDNYVKGVSRRLKQASVAPVLQQNLPVEYLRGGDIDKDQRARQIATERGITTGDVCVLSATDLAHTFEHHGTHMEIRGMHMEIRKRPSLALYHYLIHSEFGWMFARIQTWFPFAINIYVNGREWLARQMDREKAARRNFREV